MKSMAVFVVLGLLGVLAVPASLGQKPTGPAANPPSPEERAAQIAKIRREYQTPGVKVASTQPSNFPLPPYTSNVTDKGFVHSTKGTPAAALTICTKDAPDVVYKWYLDACKRAQLSTSTPTAQAMAKMGKQGDLFLITAENPKQKMNITCVRNAKDNGTIVSINWFLK